MIECRNGADSEDPYLYHRHHLTLKVPTSHGVLRKHWVYLKVLLTKSFKPADAPPIWICRCCLSKSLEATWLIYGKFRHFLSKSPSLCASIFSDDLEATTYTDGSQVRIQPPAPSPEKRRNVAPNTPEGLLVSTLTDVPMIRLLDLIKTCSTA